MLLTILTLLLTFLSSPTLSVTITNTINETQLLLKLKHSLSDPNRALSSWTTTRSNSPCTWTGVTCEPSTGSVTSLDLFSLNLAGSFPLSLCNLTSLTTLTLSNNFISSSLPSDISSCHNLRYLNLSQNLLIGNLPSSLSSLSNLLILDLSFNSFSGEVPPSFRTFQKLRDLSLVSNLLNGSFPSFLGNVPTLQQLNLSFNPFKPSQLGSELGKLEKLEVLWASGCNLVGPIPDSLSQLRMLTDLDLSSNNLSGVFPSWITELTRVVQVELFNNSLTGELPSTGWTNMGSLRQLDVSINELSGTIPDEMTQLPLVSLSLNDNKLFGEIPKSLADSPNLEELTLFSNQLTGELPIRLGENSPLRIIDVCDNFLDGEMPKNLCAKGQLEELLMKNNSLSGPIPTNLSGCRTLTRVRLKSNRLSGSLPEGIWGLPNLLLLELDHNFISGSISKSVGLGVNLSEISISRNNFSGEIPKELGNLVNLVSFIAGENRFSGSLPSSILELRQLGRLDLHENQLSGEISSGISALEKLYDLNLANNEFFGQIPSEIGMLSTLNYLDLSGNQLTGEIPEELQNLKLNEFNLSYNQLTGNLPPLFSNVIYKNSFLGNPGLCGTISGECNDDKFVVKKASHYLWVVKLMFALAAIVFLLGILWFYYKYTSFKQAKQAFDHPKWTLTSFHKLGFSEYEILSNLEEKNLLGSGASGKVYKVILSNGECVAVKKLRNFSSGLMDGFDIEVDTLGKIRHKNIVRLWCCCKTKDCKLLVYEYLPNGSLGDLLHSSKGVLLDWQTRYKIALDAAEGLSYLHHDCVPPIVHRDVKSNNILLDCNFGAKVADFGVAKVVEVNGRGIKSMSVIAGSCGYIAPEYAYTLRVNEKSDTYSFGVVILELVTGRQPIDPEYGDKDLVKWVCTTMDQKGADHVLDPVLLGSCFKEDVLKVLKIGLLCTSPLPINRPSMRRVVNMLQLVTDEGRLKLGSKDGRLTPNYYYDDA